jgi:hypothetical protein
MKKILFLSLLILPFTGCKTNNSEWKKLILNNSLEGWHIFQDDGTKSGWTVENDVFIFDAKMSSENMLVSDASLLSNKKYLSFEIKFDWKIEKGGNSGFMWGVSEDDKYKFPYQTGPEIQILDTKTYSNPKSILGGEIESNNIIEDLGKKKKFLGAVYGIYAPQKPYDGNPPGQWNSFHITIDHQNNKGKVILNGVLINDFKLKGKEWDSLVNKSKFSQSQDYEYLGEERWYGFAKSPKGFICLQDHPGKAYFKNIRIKEL